MKASEYAEQFVKDWNRHMTDDELYGKARKMLFDLSAEVTEIGEKRGGSDESFLGAYREVNLKWRAISARVEKLLGEQVLKPDGFDAFWKSNKEMARYLK